MRAAVIASMLALAMPAAADGWSAALDDAARAWREISRVDEGRKGTCTCNGTSKDGKRVILECIDNTTYDACRDWCYKMYSGCTGITFQTGAPTCFEILSGEKPWP